MRPFAQQAGGLCVALCAPVLLQALAVVVDDLACLDRGAAAPFAVSEGMGVTHGGLYVIQNSRPLRWGAGGLARPARPG